MRDLEISKELLSEVFKLNICEAYIENNTLFFDMGLPLIQSINLYEFSHKLCKEWALDKGYTIESHTNRSFISKYNREYFSVAKIFKETDSMRINTIDESTEIEAVIKASEYILKELNEN